MVDCMSGARVLHHACLYVPLMHMLLILAAYVWLAGCEVDAGLEQPQQQPPAQQLELQVTQQQERALQQVQGAGGPSLWHGLNHDGRQDTLRTV